MLKHIDNKDEFANAIKEGTVLVDFFASWCGPCRMIAPVLEQLAEENKDLLIIKVDVDKATALASQYQIQAIPTLMLFKDGKHMGTKMGYLNKNQLVKFVNQ
ncbi:MAG TPA: thioredoxin [Erysipelotrichaceae bacterium]|nr:thioredoxin [Erysipelotrichaceae bacterium]